VLLNGIGVEGLQELSSPSVISAFTTHPAYVPKCVAFTNSTRNWGLTKCESSTGKDTPESLLEIISHSL
jgi:hypothetical protein